MCNLARSFLLISLFINSGAFAKDNFSVESPIANDVKIIVFTGLNKLWVKADNLEKYKEISSMSPFKYKKPKHLAFLIEIYGIQERKMKTPPVTDNDKQYNAMLAINDQLKGKKALINCFGRNSKMGIPICQILTGGLDLAYDIISSGSSPFRPNNVKNTKLELIYKDALKNAKEKGVGIWEPYYGLFINLDND